MVMLYVQMHDKTTAVDVDSGDPCLSAYASTSNFPTMPVIKGKGRAARNANFAKAVKAQQLFIMQRLLGAFYAFLHSDRLQEYEKALKTSPNASYSEIMALLSEFLHADMQELCAAHHIAHANIASTVSNNFAEQLAQGVIVADVTVTFRPGVFAHFTISNGRIGIE